MYKGMPRPPKAANLIPQGWKHHTYHVVDAWRDRIVSELGITPVVDAFATAGNERFPVFWTEEDDAFTKDWSARGTLWINPPTNGPPFPCIWDGTACRCGPVPIDDPRGRQDRGRWCNSHRGGPRMAPNALVRPASETGRTHLPSAAAGDPFVLGHPRPYVSTAFVAHRRVPGGPLSSVPIAHNHPTRVRVARDSLDGGDGSDRGATKATGGGVSPHACGRGHCGHVTGAICFFFVCVCVCKKIPNSTLNNNKTVIANHPYL